MSILHDKIAPVVTLGVEPALEILLGTLRGLKQLLRAAASEFAQQPLDGLQACLGRSILSLRVLEMSHIQADLRTKSILRPSFELKEQICDSLYRLRP